MKQICIAENHDLLMYNSITSGRIEREKLICFFDFEIIYA